MCEWLSSSDWCDVQLLCGGRSFRAHKAVLASVSNFLRRVLLSCPVDEVPILIFLPEFDHDAISLALNYIYKGEVEIPKKKLNTFLDIVNAMEIFIDQRYIPKMNLKEKYIKVSNVRKANTQYCINIKNGMSIECVLTQLQPTFGNSNLCDNNPLRYCGWSHENVPNLGNLISQCGLRQRQPLLRDIFIETYNQNGSGNGLTAGVLAISNEHYRAPKSVLLTNVNGKHPTANNTLSEKSENAFLLNTQITSICESFKQLQYISARKEKINGRNGCILSDLSDKLEVDSYTSNCTVVNNSKNHTKSNYETSGNTSPIVIIDSSSSISSERPGSSLNIGHKTEKSDSKSFSVDSKRWDFSVAKYTATGNDQVIFEESCRITELNGLQNASRHNMTKVILNKVLQSPWRTRQPNYYKPFRKKERSPGHFQLFLQNKISKEESDEGNCNKGPRLKVDAISDAIAHEIPVMTKTSDWKCSICQQVFTNKVAYDAHMKRHTSINRYTCEECLKTFSQLRNFKYHMSIHRGTKEFATTCPVCGKYFNDRGYLSSHMKIHKNRKEYKCHSCPKSFNQRVAYNMHVRIHTGVKPHVCEECGKAFSRKMLLKQHQRLHSGERPYACAHCDKRFADRSNMILHLRLHTGEKPFSCTLCSKSFTKKHHLKAHLNFHTGAKPYSCPRCNLAFTQSSNMRTHYKKCNATETTG